MPSPVRYAGIITVFFAAGSAAKAEATAPAGPAVSIAKTVVNNGPTRTVKYTVTGGSPRLQALVRRVEWVENELTVIDQLQGLKLDTVVNERRLTSFRTTQLTNPFFSPRFNHPSIAYDIGSRGGSYLQNSLTGQLAYEATPDAALQLIGFLEQLQTDLDAELKALPPQEQEAARGPIDALRPRVSALPHRDDPQPQPKSVGPVRVVDSSAFDQKRTGTAGLVVAAAGTQAAVEVQWGGSWYDAEVLRVSGSLSQIHYTGWASSFDEWVPAGRIRPVGTVAAQ